MEEGGAVANVDQGEYSSSTFNVESRLAFKFLTLSTVGEAFLHLNFKSYDYYPYIISIPIHYKRQLQMFQKVEYG